MHTIVEKSLNICPSINFAIQSNLNQIHKRILYKGWDNNSEVILKLKVIWKTEGKAGFIERAGKEFALPKSKSMR